MNKNGSISRIEAIVKNEVRMTERACNNKQYMKTLI